MARRSFSVALNDPLRISHRLKNPSSSSFTNVAPKVSSKKVLLTRDFIKQSLYKPSEGYFSTKDCVYSPPKPIEFKDLYFTRDYNKLLQKLYKERAEAWLTPVELFAPHYSHSIGNYIMKNIPVDSQGRKKPLKIIEAGKQCSH